MRHIIVSIFCVVLGLMALPEIAAAQGVNRVCIEHTGADGSNNCTDVGPSNPFPVVQNYFAGVADAKAGTTGAVTATLPANSTKTTFICGFDVSAAGGTATVSPITVTGTLGGTLTFQGISSGAVPYSWRISPCWPGSAANTAIAVVTTADGSASAVNVQVFGYQQ